MRPEDRYDGLIRHYAELYQRDARQVKHQIRQESSFNSSAVSPAGAKGLAQFEPATWDEVMGHGDPFNPEMSIEALCKYMARLQKALGSLALALAAYNWGIGHVQKVKGEDNWRALLPAETAKYVRDGLNFQCEHVA